MKRMDKFDPFTPQTWNLGTRLRGKLTGKNYKPGRFIQRQYRIIDPQVQGAIQGQSYATFWEIKGGKVVQVTRPTTNFPFDKPSTHMDWFVNQNIKQYGLPYGKDLPFKPSTKGFGYSATGKEWESFLIGESGQFYSGKGVSAKFLRLGGSSYSGSGEGLYPESPIVYAGYFDKVVMNPAYTEIVVPSGTSAKGAKTYIFKKPFYEGQLQVPGYKLEVEGVVFGERIPVRRKYYFDWMGRKVPIEEQTFVQGLDQFRINKLGGKEAIVTGTQTSVLPTKRPWFQPSGLGAGSSYVSVSSRPSIFSSSSPISKSSTSASPISKISKVSYSSKPTSRSSVSSISKISYSPSSVSKISRSSYSSKFSSSISSSSSPPSFSTFRYGIPAGGLIRGKKKKKKVKRKTAGRLPSYKPSLTALGLPSVKFKPLKQYSGAEVRRVRKKKKRRVKR
jgi:hypothetical protein